MAFGMGLGIIPTTTATTVASPIESNDIERVDSGSGTVSVGADGLMARQVDMRWLVHSLDGYQAAEKKGRELAPLYYDGHRRGDLGCRAVGNGWYEISAQYGNAGVNAYEGRGIENDDGVVMVPSSFSLDTTGGTEHITIAYPDDTDGPIYTGYAPTGETAPESYGAINVSGGRVNGLDITVPSYSWTETWLVPAWYLFSGEEPDGVTTDSEEDPNGPLDPYAGQLHNMTGMVNDKEWRLFQPGEVLFLGARFEANRSSTMVPVTYSFAARKTREDFKIGDITVTKKDGWDYLWIDYGDQVSQDVPVKFARYVYVDQIYPRHDFADLKIGTNWPRFYLAGGEEFTHKLDKETSATLDDEKRDKA